MNKQQLQEYLADGYSTYKIAELSGRSQSNVMYWLKKHGLTTAVLRRDVRVCIGCGGEVIKLASNTGQYCSTKCHRTHSTSTRIATWLAGEYRGRPQQIPCWIRNYVLEKNNYACSLCGWDKRHPVDGLPLVEVDHIDGDATNHAPNNLQVICPNCHSMTHTFRARNKQSSRTAR